MKVKSEFYNPEDVDEVLIRMIGFKDGLIEDIVQFKDEKPWTKNWIKKFKKVYLENGFRCVTERVIRFLDGYSETIVIDVADPKGK